MTEFFMLFFLFLPTGPHGQPAPAAQVLAHVPPDATLVLALDAASLGQGINQGLEKLLASPFVKNTKALQPLTMQLTGGRAALLAEAKALGVDPFADIRFATICLGDMQAAQPKLLVTLGGKLPVTLVAKLAEKGQAKQEGGLWIFPEDDMVMTQPKPDRLILGSRPWVEMALAGKARNPGMKPLLAGLDKKTYALMAFQPDAALRQEMEQTGWAARPLLTSVRGLALRLGYQGWSLKVQTEAKSMKVWQDLLYGLGRYAVASRETIEGSLFIAEAYLSSLDPLGQLQHDLMGEDKEIVEALVTHRREIHALLTDLVSGPSPKTKVMASKKTNTVTLSVDGRGVGALMLVPVLTGGIFLGARSTVVQPVPPQPLALPPEAPPTPDPPAQPTP